MQKPLIADSSLLLVTFVWGITFVLVQNAINSLEPLAFNGIRFLVAAGLLGLWLLTFEKKQLKQISKKVILSGVFMGFWLFLGYATQTIGLLYTTSSKAGFITGLSVVLVPLFSMVLLKHSLSRNSILGVLVAAVGLFLLTASDFSSLNIGDLFVFACAISFALHIIFTGKYTASYPTLLLTVVQISTVAFLSLLSSFLFEDWKNTFRPEVLFSTNVYIALLITSLFATALAFLIQTNFQKYTTTTRVALIFAMEPVFAAVTGYVWADERLTFGALFGCLFIFTGMIFAELPAGKLIFAKKQGNDSLPAGESFGMKD